MHCNHRRNDLIESTACMYRAGPLKHHRKEVAPQVTVEKMASASSNGTEQSDAIRRVRSKNIMSAQYFPSANQHLQSQNQLYSQQLSAASSSNCSSNSNCNPTIKHSNQQFFQDGATSASALVARRVYNQKVKNLNIKFQAEHSRA